MDEVSVSITAHYNLVRVPSGFIVVDKKTDEPMIDPQGQTLLFHRIRDGERAAERQEQILDQWREVVYHDTTPPDNYIEKQLPMIGWWKRRWP